MDASSLGAVTMHLGMGLRLRLLLYLGRRGFSSHPRRYLAQRGTPPRSATELPFFPAPVSVSGIIDRALVTFGQGHNVLDMRGVFPLRLGGASQCVVGRRCLCTSTAFLGCRGGGRWLEAVEIEKEVETETKTETETETERGIEAEREMEAEAEGQQLSWSRTSGDLQSKREAELEGKLKAMTEGKSRRTSSLSW